jgi:hypothetical protein
MKRPLQIFISDNFFCLFTRLNIRNSIWMYLGCLLEVESNIWRHFFDRNTNTNTIFDISKYSLKFACRETLTPSQYVCDTFTSFFLSFIHSFCHSFLSFISSFVLSFIHLFLSFIYVFSFTEQKLSALIVSVSFL